MRRIEIIFKEMLPIVKKALNDHIDDMGNIPKIGRNPKFTDVNVITLALAARNFYRLIVKTGFLNS